MKKVKEVIKKWREKDKKMLFERIKERYLMFRRMRVNVVRVDPMRKYRGRGGKLAANRKRSKKRVTKKQQSLRQQEPPQLHTGGSRPGLRSTFNTTGELNDEKHQDILQLQNQLLSHQDSSRYLEEEKQDGGGRLSLSVSNSVFQQQDSLYEFTQPQADFD